MPQPQRIPTKLIRELRAGGKNSWASVARKLGIPLEQLRRQLGIGAKR